MYCLAKSRIDISDKSNPELITSWSGIPSAHACWVSDDGNYVFTTDEQHHTYTKVRIRRHSTTYIDIQHHQWNI